MNNELLAHDTHIMDLAARSAKAFCAKHHPWGMDVDDILTHIRIALWEDEANILVQPKDSPHREEVARVAIGRALNRVRDESKYHRARLQPFQVRKAYGAGRDVNRARRDLAEDICRDRRRGSFAALRRKHLYIAFRYMEPRDVAICRAFLELLSWKKVARRFGYSEGDFRRNVMPGLERRAQAVWKKVW